MAKLATRVSMAALVAVCVGGCARSCGPQGAPPGGVAEIRAAKADKAPIDDPASPAWQQAREAAVSLLPQQIAYPMLAEQAVKELRVRAIVDDAWLALRIDWLDPTRSDELEVDKFTDSVAVEIPLGDPEKTNPMMGDKDNPVYLCHWKAVWQRDADRGRADVEDYHPAFWADPYPFASGGHPYPVQDAFQTANARRYFAGLSAGNPVSKLYRSWPVEELHAEGFSTLADHNFQEARGRGRWDAGRWSVVLALPRRSPDPANPSFPAGAVRRIAFAAWDGDKRNVGGRKQWAPFQKLVLP